MKYFSCQPDTHNGFGLLIGRTLTYFTVECSEQTGTTNKSQSGLTKDDESVSFLSMQYTVTLPHDFGTAPNCFSMANRSLYGFDMAFVGASTGVMAVVVMSTCGVIYAPGRTLASMRTDSAVVSTTAKDSDYGATPRISSPQSISANDGSLFSPTSLSAADRSVGTITWMRDKPLVFVGFTSGRIEWYRVTVSDSWHEKHGMEGSPMNTSLLTKTTAPTTTDCLSDRRNVNDKGQKQHVEYTAGKFDAAAASGYRIFPPNVWLHGGDLGKWSATQRTYEDGDGDGVRIRWHVSCTFPETGAFLTSDWFPATGYVVAGAERAVYVFSTDQPETPLYCLSSIGSGFLACHPFLPILCCLSFGKSAEMDTISDACIVHVLKWTDDGVLCQAIDKRVFREASRHGVYYSCTWKFSYDLQVAICNVKEGAVHLLSLVKAEGGLESPPQEDGTDMGATEGTLTSFSRPLYTFTGERQLSLPLHSLINMEFISSATHTLLGMTSSSLSTIPASQKATNNVVLRERVLAERILHSFGGQRKARHVYSCRKAARMRSLKSGTDYLYDSDKGDNDKGCLHGVAHDDFVVRAGEGVFTRIVGVNHAGEIAVIPVSADATVSILRPGIFAVGLYGSVLMLDAGAGASDMGHRMKKRLAAGFGVPAEANVRALSEFGDPSEANLRILFLYITIMEKVGVVGSSGPVPSMIELLSLAKAPSTAQLLDMKLLPHGAAVVCSSSISRNDSRRLLLLHLLCWIPSQELFPRGEEDAEMKYTRREEVERAVAVEVLHKRRARAIELLQRHHLLDPTYLTLAGFLEHYEGNFDLLPDAQVEVWEGFLRRLSPWLQIVFLHERDRARVYTNVSIPLWDRMAIAVILERDTTQLISFLSGAFALECDMIQRLLLLEGISERSFPLMQQIVDQTGDFQLAACLFARIGTRSVLASASASATTPIPDADLQVPVVETATDNAGMPREEYGAYLWELWSAAYRTFLRDEREFVKCAMFDLACQQISGNHGSETKLSTTSHCHQDHQDQQQQLTQPEVYSQSSHFTPLVQCNVESTQSGTQENRFSQRPLLASKERLCSVCSKLVFLKWHCAEDSFAWCTTCHHGGHANHLQEWFLTHRKCPMYGCGCFCEQGVNRL